MDSWQVVGKATTLNLPGMAVLVTAVFAVLLSQRKLLPIVFVTTACFVTIGQQLVLGPMSLDIMRLMIAAAFIRTVLRNEAGLAELNSLDKALIAWVVVGTVAYALRVKGLNAIIGRLGRSYDALGLYFMFRLSIRELSSLHVIFRAMAGAMTVLMLLMCVERFTGLNPFSVFGGVPEYTTIREGYLRVQGPFRHPILAGTLGATSIPLFASLWHGGARDRRLAMTGIVSSIMIVALTASSSPLIASAAAFVSIALWSFRKNLREVWRLLVIGIAALALVMKAPVWYVMDRVSNVLGGTGWHRAMLIDQSISHFGEWWIAGTSYTAHWMPYQLAANPDMSDITNQFLSEGISGGILTMCAFILIVIIAFRILSSAARTDKLDPPEMRIVWAFWGSLVAHVVTFFSVPYFDQITVFWYMLLASISLVSTRASPGLLFLANRVMTRSKA